MFECSLLKMTLTLDKDLKVKGHLEDALTGSMVMKGTYLSLYYIMIVCNICRFLEYM